MRKPNAPPADQPWVWMTREMLESPAWAAMTLNARKVVERVMIEHMAHGGTQNGELIVTYDDFAAHGISSRRQTALGVRVAEALGFLLVAARGMRSYGGARRPSQYGLTWLPLCDRTPAADTWRRITSDQQAREAIAAVSQPVESGNASAPATARIAA